MRLLLATFLVASATCSTVPVSRPAAPAVPLTSPAGTRYGLTDGWYTGVPFYVLGAYCDAGPTVVRSPARSVDEARAIVESERACTTTQSHILIERDDAALASAIGAYAAVEPRITDIECGNELELPPRSLSVSVASTFVTSCHQNLRAAGYTGRVLTGAIYTVDEEQLKRLTAYHAACPTCTCALHWYASDLSQWKKQLDAIGCPDYAITEMGIPSRNAAEDAHAVIYYKEELQGFWALGHVSLIEAYQRPSGPSTTNLDNFGLWRFDDSPKPIWDLWRSLLH